jgi:hypothetical protein
VTSKRRGQGVRISRHEARREPTPTDVGERGLEGRTHSSRPGSGKAASGEGKVRSAQGADADDLSTSDHIPTASLWLSVSRDDGWALWRFCRGPEDLIGQGADQGVLLGLVRGRRL